MRCDSIDSSADVTFSVAQFPDVVLIKEHVMRSSVLSTMVSSAEEDETSFTAPKGYLQAWLELVQDDTPQLPMTKDIESLLVLLKVCSTRNSAAW